MEKIWSGFKLPKDSLFVYSPCGKFYKYGKIDLEEKRIVWSEIRYTGESGKNGMPNMPRQ